MQAKEMHPEHTVAETRAGYNGIYNRVIKRGIDCVLALCASVLVTPILLLLSVFIAIEDGFPVFYTPLRGGYRGKPFHIFKLRTMYKGADKLGGTTALNDPRITNTGRILRKLKLDELPQVYNVLLGTMSFVGPRPELLRYTDAYEGEEKLILEVRPGITDFSSIEFISLDEIVGAENADEMYEKYVLQRKNQLRIRYGMVFCAITGTPCIALSNYNHKVKETYRWLQQLPYIRFYEAAEDAVRVISELYRLGGGCYDSQFAEPYFEEIANYINNYLK